jgi:hypothetical protein
MLIVVFTGMKEVYQGERWRDLKDALIGIH